MKRLWVAILAVTFLFSFAVAEEVTVLTPQEATARMESLSYLNLFDVRSSEEYAQLHIPGAINFPLETIKAQVKEILDSGYSYMEAEIFVYGSTQEDAASAAGQLKELGFIHVFSLGAAQEWPYEMISSQEEERRARMILADFEAEDIWGNPANEDVLKGYKLTMVNVWATYCNPCLAELPDLAALAEDMQEMGVQIIGIVSDGYNDSKIELAQEIIELTKADYLHLLPSETLHQKLLSNVTSVPTTIFVDETGTMVGYAYIGSRNYDQWQRVIEEVMALLPSEEVER
ncbi:MAG: redoxin domain-containing protein [Clostridiales bacterium]|nr:redoxin domain-containing protein [Clostridiales bacterium]